MRNLQSLRQLRRIRCRIRCRILIKDFPKLAKEQSTLLKEYARKMPEQERRPRGEHIQRGFYARDISAHLGLRRTRDPQERRRQSGRVGRFLQLLRARGLINKLPHARRYRVSDKGLAIMCAAIHIRFLARRAERIERAAELFARLSSATIRLGILADGRALPSVVANGTGPKIGFGWVSGHDNSKRSVTRPHRHHVDAGLWKGREQG